MSSSIAKKLTNVSTLYYLFVLEKHFPDDRKKIKQKQNKKNNIRRNRSRKYTMRVDTVEKKDETLQETEQRELLLPAVIEEKKNRDLWTT